MKKQLILIGGIAGSGKSTIADYISKGYPFVYVDKDNVTSILMESLLIEIGKPACDRESKDYIEKVRPYEYEQFEETIFHISTNNYVVGAAPFLKEFQDKEWVKKINQKVLKQKDELILIWVKTKPEETKERLIERNEERDYYKLSIFEEYSKEIEKVQENIIKTLKEIQTEQKIKVSFVDNFNGTLEETFDKIDTIIYNINS